MNDDFPNDSILSGYDFIGWSINSIEGDFITKSTVMENEDITLYAIWKIKEVEEPIVPTDPEDSNEDKEPEKPVEPQNPTDKKNSNTPKTGTRNQSYFYMVALISSMIIVLSLIKLKRSRHV